MLSLSRLEERGFFLKNLSTPSDLLAKPDEDLLLSSDALLKLNLGVDCILTFDP